MEQVRIVEILNLPLVHRTPELGIIINRASLKELQEVFPLLINSIFGAGTGWGFRTTTRDLNPQDYEILYNFFTPLGTMFRLLYRLLNDNLKYEVPLAALPPKMQQMFESGRYSTFYADLINIDPFRRQITSLSLNAFDFFMLHFAIHGTHLLNRIPAGLPQASDRVQTVYYHLAADYLSTFLPAHPDAVILPQIGGAGIKSTISPVPSSIQPAKTKYLLLSALTASAHAQTPHKQQQPRADALRGNTWRTESTLYFFVDAWLRCDFEESPLLPGNEFVRCARVLVKQLHAFGNVAELDNTSMAILRQMAQPLMTALIVPFLKSLVNRWPLDSSFSDVLELWLSFIQPWRYVLNRNLMQIAEQPVPPRFDQFIAENLAVYTQMFVRLLPRFERLDLSSNKNVHMLCRLLKVISQSNLAPILRRFEAALQLNASQLSPDDGYSPLFGEATLLKLHDLARKIAFARVVGRERLRKLEAERARRRGSGFWAFLCSLFAWDEDPVLEAAFRDRQRMPESLAFCLECLACVFDVRVPEPQLGPDEVDGELADSFVSFDASRNASAGEFSDLSPSFWRANLRHISYSGDPALVPIGDHEIAFLVRFLHQASAKLNLMFGAELKALWHRRDFLGRLARQALYPPMETRVFDKKRGISELVCAELSPRICLRSLAAYKTLSLVLGALLFGYLFWGVPSFGLFLLGFTAFLVMGFRALVYDFNPEREM